MLNKFKYRQQLRQEVISMFHQPTNAYSFTITFVEGLDERKCHSSFNFLLTILTEKLFGKFHHKRNEYLKGFVTREYQANGTVHFHGIIQDPDNNLEDRISFNDALLKALPRVQAWVSNQLQDGTVKWIKSQVTNSKSTHCEPYYDNSGKGDYEKYITKLFENSFLDVRVICDQIGIIDNGEVIFGQSYH